MGYLYCIGSCFACGRTFTYSPSRVPSIPINGERQAICASCVTRVNPMRIDNGLPPIVPLPGAYEPDDE